MRRILVINLILICLCRVVIYAEVPRAAKQIPMPEGTRSVRYFSWFPDSQRVAMRLTQRRGKKDNSVIAVVNVESASVKILSEPNIKHAYPTCAPDGKTIAYIGPMGNHSTIWLMNANGKNKRPLVNLRCWYRPVWSPDSRMIAFVLRNSGIWVVNADGSGLRKLTPGPGYHSSPKWSPESNLIAFKTNSEIWLINPDGSNRRPLTELVSERGYGPIEDSDSLFDWSADGKQIVYAYRPIPPEGKHVTYDGGVHPYQIWVININGSGKRCLTLGDISCGYPVFMPDGKQILYESVYKWVVTKRLNPGVKYPERNIWMLDLVTKKKYQLTDTEMITEFALSPDGRKVVFSTDGRNPFLLELR